MNPVSKICLLIAASDEQTDGIEAFARWMDATGPQEFVNLITRLRRLVPVKAGISLDDVEDRRQGRSSERVAYHSSNRTSSRSIDNLAAKLEQLLVFDAGLSKTESAKLLVAELIEERAIEGAIPEYGKAGFNSWLKRLLDQVPESVMLHVATRLRNRITHSDRSLLDWSLKQDKEE